MSATGQLLGALREHDQVLRALNALPLTDPARPVLARNLVDLEREITALEDPGLLHVTITPAITPLNRRKIA